MKLTQLSEYLDVAKSANDFYGDPKSKAKPVHPGKGNMSFLKGGVEDRNRFLGKMNKKKKRK